MFKEALQNLTEAEADDIIAGWKAEGYQSVKIPQDDGLWTVMTVEYPAPEAGGRTEPAAAGPAEYDSELGALSRKYESNGDPGIIGQDKTGGYSYGQYQIATRTGTMEAFLVFLAKANPDFAARLDAAGGLKGAIEGTKSFQAAWKDLGKMEEFARVQHAFIQTTHYEPFAANLKQIGLELKPRSKALKDVAWSVAVQHGPGNAVFKNALKGRDPSTMSDAEIIEAVYMERSKVDVYFSKSKTSVKAALVGRFDRERRDALALLGSGVK
ncbi:MAG: hypothetical protein ABFD97_08635 [Syntrophobacter sp.]